jgi:hypothetical protein
MKAAQGKRGNSHTSFLSARSLLVFVLCFTVGGLLFGQEGYRIEKDGRFVQILGWPEQENVLYYEVEIEQRRENDWASALTTETGNAFIEVSLVPGTYRYRVRVYDFLGRSAEISDWIQFDVLLARQPELFRFGPEAFYLDEDIVWILTLWGQNLVEGAEIYILNQGIRGNRIIPQTVTIERSEEGARLVFSLAQLDVGDYTIRVVNPGGLETSLGTFRIAFRKPLDINVSAGYRPLIPLYGQINDLFAQGLFPLGIYARLSIVPFKHRWGYLGFEIEPAWNYLHASGDGYEVQAQMIGGALYGVYQWWFPNRIMALSFRLGGGIYPIVDYYFSYGTGNSEPIMILIPIMATGISFQWFFKKPFYVEIGTDFTHFFTVDSSSQGFFRPSLGIGYSF